MQAKTILAKASAKLAVLHAKMEKITSKMKAFNASDGARRLARIST
jgi:hypothetical protein